MVNKLLKNSFKLSLTGLLVFELNCGSAMEKPKDNTESCINSNLMANSNITPIMNNNQKSNGPKHNTANSATSDIIHNASLMPNSINVSAINTVHNTLLANNTVPNVSALLANDSRQNLERMLNGFYKSLPILKPIISKVELLKSALIAKNNTIESMNTKYKDVINGDSLDVNDVSINLYANDNMNKASVYSNACKRFKTNLEKNKDEFLEDLKKYANDFKSYLSRLYAVILGADSNSMDDKLKVFDKAFKIYSKENSEYKSKICNIKYCIGFYIQNELIEHKANNQWISNFKNNQIINRYIDYDFIEIFDCEIRKCEDLIDKYNIFLYKLPEKK